MTREEREKAIDALKISAPVMAVTQEEFNDYIQTLNKIMDWLEQEPCDDCISRDKTIVQLSHLLSDWDDDWNVAIRKCIETVKIVPPVTPAEKVGQWIPVSERLPEEETDVLICNAKGDIEVSRGSYSTEMKNEFIWYTSGWRFGKVVAWMPLPEPYKASPTRTERSEKE